MNWILGKAILNRILNESFFLAKFKHWIESDWVSPTTTLSREQAAQGSEPSTRKSSASATSYLKEWNHKWNTDTEDKYSEACWYHIKSISCWLPHQVIRLQPHKTALLCGLHIHQVVDISPASPVQSCTCQKNALTWSRRGGNSKCCECCYRFAAPGDGCTIVWRLVGGWYNPTMQWLVVGTSYKWLVVRKTHQWLVVGTIL